MSGVSYFEIGGQLIESHVDTPTPRPQAVTAKSISKQLDVPTPMVRSVDRGVKQKTGISPLKVAEKHGRARRAIWAFSTAATIAAADGPLPFGDVVAIGFLGAYGIYETHQIVTDWD